MNYHGDVDMKAVKRCLFREGNDRVSRLNLSSDYGLMVSSTVSFANIIPDDQRLYINLNKKCIDVLPDDGFGSKRYNKMNLSMVGNNIAIGRVFEERIGRKCDLMYSQKAYIHWYTELGMEESEFIEARENLRNLYTDYCDIVSDELSDDDSE